MIGGIHERTAVLFARKCVAFVLCVLFVFSDLGTLLNTSMLPTVERAAASTGDFAIFRESAGAQTVASTTVFVHPWDSTVQSNSNITLGGDGRSIDLADGGKYLVIYNSMFEEGTTTGTNRRSVESWLTLNGTELPYGRASAYMRDTDGLTEAYISGGAIINAGMGDDLDLRMIRNDINDAGTNIAPDKDSISVLKLKDSWDYLRIHQSATTTGVDSNTTFTDVSFDTSDEVDTDSFGFTPASGVITLKGGNEKHFLVTSNVTLFTDHETATRQNYEMRLTLDGVEIPGTRVTAYPRGNQSGEIIKYATLSYMGIISKDAVGDQVLNLELRRESSGSRTTDIVADETAIAMVALPDTAEYIRLGDTSGSQALSNTFTDMTWNTQYEVDTTAFSHSVVSATDEIQIDKAGNYLFFATAYATTTNGDNNRQPFTVNWKKSGSTQNRGSFGSYNRNNQTDAGGSSGAIIFENLSVSDYIEIEHADESDNAPDTSTFSANGIAIQGLALNDNLYGTDVIVSATGTHATVVDAPTANVYQGGAFVIAEDSLSRNITSITFTESGTIDAENGLDNIELWYELSTTSPYDCSEHAYDGNETQFGTTDTNGFTGANGVSSFSDTVTITTTQTFCGYLVYDVTATATDGQTIDINIANNQSDVSVSGGASIGPIGSSGPTGSTTVQNAELTQIHYHWRNDNGSEIAATSLTGGVEDVSTGGFSNGTTRRLRLGVSAEGSTSSAAVQYRLEYGVKGASCDVVSTWVDVGTGGGGDWDVVDSTNLTDGDDTTNISVANGGVTDEEESFVLNNNAVKDAGSQVSAITATSGSFIELEYALEPTVSATEGNTYCFRLTDAGTPLRNYDVYPEATISADVTVSATGTHTGTADIPQNNVYVGGKFVFRENTSSRNITGITLTEVGSVDATNLSNPRLFIDFDTSLPYDCASETLDIINDTNVSGSAFTSENGTTTFTGSATITTGQTLCAYLVVDVDVGAAHGETMQFEISTPNTDVVVDTGSVGPGTAVSMASSTYLEGPVVTQTHYHWRNDDGSEVGATSATGGSEDTAITNIRQNDPYRLRIGISNEGPTTTTNGRQFQLEYGAKILSCSAVTLWEDVGASGAAFDMYDSTNLTDGNDTTDVDVANGGVTDEGTAFITNNNAVKDTSSLVASMDLVEDEYTALEYSIVATENSAYATDYCFRVTDAGERIDSYVIYPELTTAEKRDFSVQRGVVTISPGNTATTITAGVDYTAPSASTSAFIRITNSHNTGAGSELNGGNQNALDVTAFIENPSNLLSSVTFSRVGTTDSTRIAWEIVEYIGLPGADNEMKVHLQNSLTFGSSALIATGTATTSVSDGDDVVVFVTGLQNPDIGRNDYNTVLATAEWASSTGQPVFTRGESSGDAIGLSYAVVEFSGANWNIQRVEHTYIASGTPEIENISPVNSRDRTFIHTQKRSGTGLQGLDEFGHEVELSSIGAVTFTLEPGSDNPANQVSVAWVIENTQTGVGAMEVFRSDGTLSGGTSPATHIIGIGDTLNGIDNASIFVNNRSSGTGTSYPRGYLGARILTTTEYELWRSNTGQTRTYRTEIVQWPIAELSIRQNYYRFYVDNDTLTPTDPWPVGGVNLGENTSITVADEPLGEDAVVRMRMSYAISNATLPSGVEAFKLQYGEFETSCSAITEWFDVGQTASGTIWRAHDGAPADGATLPSTLLFPSDVAGTYEENNISAANPNTVSIEQDIEYDWVVEHNGALEKTEYCFRTVRSSGALLEGYNNYPMLRTAGFGPRTLNWRWYDDAENLTPSSPLAVENSAPIDVANDNEIKLRVTVEDAAGANGTNVKFKLQYSQYSDFRTVFDVQASSTCEENDLWCYADGAGNDNELIVTSTLSDADSCIAGVGDGCGYRNEATTTLPSFVHGSLNKSEYEFTIQHAGARVNTVYYFRLYNINDDQPVAASSSYPSLVTEGASVVFTTESLATSTVIDGVTTDVATTPIAVPFGDLPFGSEIEAAQRITVDTNGTEGYQVYVFSQSDLVSNQGETIANIAASNTAPLAWNAGCAADGPSCFGYHPSDDTLSGGSTRFAPNDSYAALDGELGEIGHSSAPAVNESVDVIYRIRVTEAQAAGQYEAGIVYIIVPIF